MVELAPQVADVHIDVAPRVEAQIPHLAEQLGPRHDMVRPAPEALVRWLVAGAADPRLGDLRCQQPPLLRNALGSAKPMPMKMAVQPREPWNVCTPSMTLYP